MVGFYKSLERYFSGRLARTWFARPNTSPLFAGARPVETATEGGLPQILAIRTFFDALRGGTRKTKLSVRGPVRCCQQPTALGGLVDADELQVLAEIEGQRRLLAKRGPNPHLYPRELAWRRRDRGLRIYGDTHINAAFTFPG